MTSLPLTLTPTLVIILSPASPPNPALENPTGAHKTGRTWPKLAHREEKTKLADNIQGIKIDLTYNSRFLAS